MNEERKYKLVNLMRYLGDGFFYPFLALYFSYLSKTESQIGWLMMIIPLLGALVNPLWSKLSKNINYNRKYLKVLTIIEAVSIIYLLFVVKLPLLVIGTIILGIVGQPFYALFDGYTAVYTLQENKNYAPIRLYGSLGFAFGALIAGYLLEITSFTVIFSITASIFVLISLVVAWIKPLNLDLDKTLVEKAEPKQLVKNGLFIKFVIYFVITWALLFGGDAFLGVYFKSLAIESGLYGLILFVQVILEAVVLFFLAKWKHKDKLMITMIAIVLANFFRFFIFGIDAPISLIIFASVLRPITVGGMLYVSIEYLKLKVSSKNITLAIMISHSLKNIIQAVYTLLGGYYIEKFSYQSFYLYTAFITLLALFFIDYKQNRDIIGKDVSR